MIGTNDTEFSLNGKDIRNTSKTAIGDGKYLK